MLLPQLFDAGEAGSRKDLDLSGAVKRPHFASLMTSLKFIDVCENVSMADAKNTRH